MKHLLTLDYWFNLQPKLLIAPTQKIFIGGIILLAILAVIIILIKKRGGIYRGILNSLYLFCLTNTLLGLILFFFNYEKIPFFSARFWLGIWIITMLVWSIFIFKKLKNIPLRKKQLEKDQEFKKYLP